MSFQDGQRVRVEGNPSNRNYGQVGIIVRVKPDGWYGVLLGKGEYIERMGEDLTADQEGAHGLQVQKAVIQGNRRIPFEDMTIKAFKEMFSLEPVKGEEYMSEIGDVFQVIAVKDSSVLLVRI